MALLSGLAGSWNSLRVDATAMPANLHLMCKLMALAFLATRHFQQYQSPFLPFVEGLDTLMPGAAFQLGLRVVAIAAAVLLLFNFSPRGTAFALGSCMLLAVLSSRTYYGNNKTFVGLMLVLAALADFDRPPWLVRWQFALVYFGAALNKLLDPDWQSGLFFDYWGGERLQNPVFLAARSWLPPLVAGKIMCWLTIVGEFAICVCVLVPSLPTFALALNLVFQIGFLEFTGDTFNLFFYAMMAASFAFVPIPTTKIAEAHGLFAGARNSLWRAACDSPWVWMIAVIVLAVCPNPLSRRVWVAVVCLAWFVGAWIMSREHAALERRM